MEHTDDNSIVIFDTNCVLCSGIVAFILAHERGPTLRFAGAWSPDGLRLAAQHGFTKSDLNETFLVIADHTALSRSDGALYILKRLKVPWRLLTALSIVPRGIRDAVYDYIARRRYGWFGERADCVIVPLDQRHRFIGVGAFAGETGSLS